MVADLIRLPYSFAMANVSTAVSLDPEVLTAAKEDAHAAGVSFSAWVNQAIYERHMREMLVGYRAWQERNGYTDPDYLSHQRRHVATMAQMTAQVDGSDRTP
jgi:hypothetical protein